MDKPGGGAPVDETADANANREEEISTGGKNLEIGNFRVFTDLRLPEFDMGHCKAYAADNLRRSEGNAFALVTDPVLPTRYDLIFLIELSPIGRFSGAKPWCFSLKSQRVATLSFLLASSAQLMNKTSPHRWSNR